MQSKYPVQADGDTGVSGNLHHKSTRNRKGRHSRPSHLYPNPAPARVPAIPPLRQKLNQFKSRLPPIRIRIASAESINRMLIVANRVTHGATSCLNRASAKLIVLSCGLAAEDEADTFPTRPVFRKCQNRRHDQPSQHQRRTAGNRLAVEEFIAIRHTIVKDENETWESGARQLVAGSCWLIASALLALWVYARSLDFARGDRNFRCGALAISHQPVFN
jgi:hypothetical protein